MQPMKLAKEQLHLAGIEIRTTNSKEADPATAKIGKLWQDFLAQGLNETIPNQKNPEQLFSVYTNYESDFTGEYSVILAKELANLSNLPENLVTLTVPQAEYLVFPVQGEMPAAIVQTWQIIWNYFSEDNTEYQRAYTTDFELHNLASNQAAIYIAVKEREQD